MVVVPNLQPQVVLSRRGHIAMVVLDAGARNDVEHGPLVALCTQTQSRQDTLIEYPECDGNMRHTPKTKHTNAYEIHQTQTINSIAFGVLLVTIQTLIRVRGGGGVCVCVFGTEQDIERA